MLTYPSIDPVAVAVGPLKVHWYGLMYLLGFAAFWWLGKRRARTQPWSPVRPEQVSDMLFYGALGVVLGGRIGYVLFYDLAAVADDPLRLLRLWEGGMSFHGGLIGVLLSMVWVARKYATTFLRIGDFVAPMIPIGLGAGRIGNFINGELWGRTTDVPWAMVFPGGGPLARHPSQLYQFALEGVALFLLLWLFSMRRRPVGAVSGLFLAGYAVFRFVVEFVREPDAHLGFLAFGWLTMGQLLTVPMFLAGLALMLWAYRRDRRHGEEPVA
jgi:phosphatidylglycerol:prolipoprotein diacylglycerol transferase